MQSIGDSQALPQVSTPAPTKFDKIWNIFNEFIVKELFSSVLRHTWYRLVHWLNPNKHGLDTPMLFAEQDQRVAKVVILLHGMQGSPGCFLPLAEKFYKENIRNIYTVNLNQTDDDPVPVGTLAEKIDAITKECLDHKGYSKVDFALIGHSLGALAASKYIWRNQKKTDVSMIISLAGRLQFVPNRLSYFCGEDVKQEIDATFDRYKRNPDMAKLYTIRGDQDGLISPESAHIQNNSEREFTAPGWAHGGIVFSPEAHEKIISWIQDWK
jgi:predicted alpha/beta hydrolase family esterase